MREKSRQNAENEQFLIWRQELKLRGKSRQNTKNKQTLLWIAGSTSGILQVKRNSEAFVTVTIFKASAPSSCLMSLLVSLTKMSLIGTEIWYVYARTSPSSWPATRWTSRTGKSKPNPLFFIEKRIFRWALFERKVVLVALFHHDFLLVLWHLRQVQLQFWEAFLVVGPQVDRRSQPRICGHACLATTWSSNGSQLAETSGKGLHRSPRYRPAWRWWRLINVFTNVLGCHHFYPNIHRSLVSFLKSLFSK